MGKQTWGKPPRIHGRKQIADVRSAAQEVKAEEGVLLSSRRLQAKGRPKDQVSLAHLVAAMG